MARNSALAKIVELAAHARRTAEAALAANPNDPNVARATAALFDGLADYGRALECAQSAARLAPKDGAVQLQMAIILQHMGDFSGAKAAYQRTIALAPLAAWAHLGVAEMSEAGENPDGPQRYARLFEEVRQDPMAALLAGHAAAKALERRGEYPASFEWLLRGKNAFASTRKFDFEAARATHNAALIDISSAPAGTSDAAPIFVVGLPRTGTTLVDRVISSHPLVRSAGELSNLQLMANSLAGVPPTTALSATVLKRAPSFDFDDLGVSYVESALARSEDKRRFVDKSPLNYILAPIIHRALPNARIVCMRRDPADACMSMFKQLLPVQFGQYDFAFRLEDCARYVALFERFADELKRILPPERYLEVRYERFVSNFEAEARNLIAFLGLDWDDRCLAFHENAAPVATPSARQVRQPIYSSSVGAWRRYGDAFAPTLDVLRQEGIAV